ncbi:MAG: bifunctional glutamate N-acetyltransferase/amino-acid acetyltransferase ArgJ [Candidatus Altiarchaeota archaeon]
MDYKPTKRGVCTEGFKAYGVRDGKYGVAVVKADQVCDSVGVFTRNSVKAAPVTLSKRAVKNGLQAVVANSGNANACVSHGMEDAMDVMKAASLEMGVHTRNIAVASTGIIGRPMDVNKVVGLMKFSSARLSCSGKASIEAAKAIMTTDTFPKQYSIEHEGIQVGGILKGAGMIAPDMATMLCFITTNADVSRGVMQKSLSDAVGGSFNMTVVDGDMSTNDVVLLLSNRRRKCSPGLFKSMLSNVCVGLCRQMAVDGEGASKFIEFNVNGGGSVVEARKAAKAVASSPLVKTAFYGENPNWGRILASIGSVVSIDYRKVSIVFESDKGAAVLLKNGVMGDLKQARKILKSSEITVTVNLSKGRYSATSWGCDMTPEYVMINAGYN